MTKVEIDIEEEMLEEIKVIADENETSPGEVVREMLTFSLAHLDQIFEDEEPPEDLDNDEENNGDDD